MSFIFLRTDAFANNLRLQSKNEGKDLIDGKDALGAKRPIRRPYRGIQIKEDRYSTISVLEPGNKPVNLISSSEVGGTMTKGKTGQVWEYADYILQAINETRAEKQQIIETFGDPYVYFFGERPRIIDVRGLLINTEDFNWKSQFWKNYDEYFRGTKLVERNARVYLSWDTNIVEGYMLTAQASETSEEPYTVPFSFQMLVTGYFDWSDIGQTRFPGFDQTLESLDVLNRELEDRRSQFTSTTAQVRLKNLLAEDVGGFKGFINAAGRLAGKIESFATGIIDKIGNVVGGRTVRVPIGVAGFLQSTGAAQIGVGSIGGSAILSAEGLGKQYDAATGKFEGLNGSVKLRMPGAAMFAPSWISPISKTERGFIFENIDEYPTRAEPTLLRQLLTLDQYIDVVNRKVNRQLAITENEFRLAMYEQLNAGGGFLGDLADAVSYAKGAFGMAMTGLAFYNNFESSLKATLGISEIGGDVSQSRIEGRRDQLEKQGIKTSYEDKSFLSRVGNFIGGSALRTFGAMATGEAEDPKPVSLGQAYNESSYQQVQEEAGEGDFAYEPAYVNQNYNALTSVNSEVQSTLDEVYGNTYNDSDVDPESLSEVYGTGSSSPAVRTQEEIAAILASIQSGTPDDSDENRTGIVGVGDDDAPIDPVV